MRGRLRGLSTPVRVLLAIAVLAATALGVALAMLRPDLGAWSPVRYALSFVALFGLAVVAAVVFLRPLSARPLSMRWIGAVVVLALLLPAALALAPPAHGGTGARIGSFHASGFWIAAAKCLILGSIFALPALLLLFLVDRRDGLAPGRGLLAAGVGGLAGNLALFLHCPLVSRAHLLAGHATVPLFLALVLVGVAKWRCNRRGSSS